MLQCQIGPFAFQVFCGQIAIRHHQLSSALLHLLFELSVCLLQCEGDLMTSGQIIPNQPNHAKQELPVEHHPQPHGPSGGLRLQIRCRVSSGEQIKFILFQFFYFSLEIRSVGAADDRD